jgi:hypothetical protein
MMNNYFLFTSKLFVPVVSVLDASLVMPNWNQPAAFKEGFLAVFFLFLAVPSALNRQVKKSINSLFNSQIPTQNYLLDCASLEGRGGGGGGGHGGLFSQVMRI